MDFDIVRAWKDIHYRRSLTVEQQALLPENPVGDFELSEADLGIVNGGSGASFVDCQVTGGEHSACPTFGNPNGFCGTLFVPPPAPMPPVPAPMPPALPVS